MNPEAATGPALARVPHRVLNARIRNFRGKTLVAVNDEAFELTETAAFIWKAIDGSRTIADISQALVAEYDIDKSTALADVGELVDSLARAGLLAY